MARFSGEIGYGESHENPPGSDKWEDTIVERSYFGDVIRNSRRLDPGEQANPSITMGNSFSIVIDEYVAGHYHNIKYLKWEGVPWTVTNVEVRGPRLIIDIGEVWNGKTV